VTIMKCRKVSRLILVCVVCSLWILSSMHLVESLSSSHDRIPKAKKTVNFDTNYTPSVHTPTSKSQIEDEFRISTATIHDRRDFLSRKISLFAAAVVGSAAATPLASHAADNSVVTAPGGVKISKRAGGLAQKIRGGVCLKMVSS
jgi:hypothetical protein